MFELNKKKKMATENKKGGGILKLRKALAFAKSRITSISAVVSQ